MSHVISHVIFHVILYIVAWFVELSLRMTLCGGEDVVFLFIDWVKQGLGFIKEAKLYQSAKFEPKF